nr:putative NAD(P)-binding Rossmann-fold superfamily protein [Tanacetum cinerariifolium]
MEKLKDMGFDVHLFDANNDPPSKLEVVDILNEYTHILVSIPPCKDIGDPMLQHVDLLKTRMNNECLQWLCYLSTTGVYGDCGGGWVDEKLAAEEGWLSLGHDLFAAHVFRLGGIYGPGRSAIDTIIRKGALSEVQRGRSFNKYTSCVHFADICNALNESIHKPSPGRIYNIVDDDPAPRTEVFSFAHKLIKEKWPSEIKKVVSPAITESFTGERSLRGEKRVVNERMKNELGVRLLHPSYRSGLQSVSDQTLNYAISSSCE